jgi:hypothetical protein
MAVGHFSIGATFAGIRPGPFTVSARTRGRVVMSRWQLLTVAALFVTAGTARAEDQDVVIVQGPVARAIKAKVGEVIRITGTIQSGQPGSITAKVDGPGKLVATNKIRNAGEGKIETNVSSREFEIKAEQKGRIKITLLFDNKAQKTTDRIEYLIDAE